MSLHLIHIYSFKLFFLKSILIAKVIFYYLVLIKLQVGHITLFPVYWNFPSPVELVITQSLDYFNSRFTSQLINSISRVLQKLLKYFSGTIISVSFVLPAARVLPVIFTL